MKALVCILVSSVSIAALAVCVRARMPDVQSASSNAVPVEASSSRFEARQTARRAARAAAATNKDRKNAERCGISLEDWCSMSRNAQKRARQAACAKARGMTVEQLKAETNRKQAEKAGCPVEKWSAMSVKERIAFRKQAKAKQG